MSVREFPSGLAAVAISVVLGSCSGSSGSTVFEPPAYDADQSLAQLGLCQEDVEAILASQGLGLASSSEVQGASERESFAGESCMDSVWWDSNSDRLLDTFEVQFEDCIDFDAGHVSNGVALLELYFDSASIPSWSYDLFDDITTQAAVGIRLSMRVEFEGLFWNDDHSQSFEAILLAFPDEGIVRAKFCSLTDDAGLVQMSDVGYYTESTLTYSLEDPLRPPVGTTRTELIDLVSSEEIARVYVSRGADENGNDASRFWVSGPDETPNDSLPQTPVAGGPLMPWNSYYSPVYEQPDYFGAMNTDYGPDNAIGSFWNAPADLYSSSPYE